MTRHILWAKQNPKRAFHALIVINIVLFTIAFFLGLLLGPIDRTLFYVSQVVIGSVMVVTFVLHYYYRSRATGPIPDTWKTGFRIRLLSLNLCIFSLFVLNGMDLVSPAFEAQPISTSIMQSTAARSLDNDPANQFKRLEQFALTVRNRVKKKFKSPFERLGLNDTARIIISALFIIAAAALMVFIIAYACALACTEMAAIASVILLGGLVMTIFGFPIIFTKIWGIQFREKRGWFKLFALSLIGIPLLFGIGIATLETSVVLGVLLVVGLAVGMSFWARRIRLKQKQINAESDQGDSESVLP